MWFLIQKGYRYALFIPFSSRIEKSRKAYYTKVQLKNAKIEYKKLFSHEEELKTKSARLADLNTLLNMDKKDNEIGDGESRLQVLKDISLDK